MKHFMEINRETALRLWKACFGNKQKAYDFTGRIIAKAAYNDRNSEFGWNIDHILPQSRGGKTADHNLICCHILTNDEKADKFPCFVANGKEYEIRKKQNHYEIVAKAPNASDPKEDEEESINLLDINEGLACWKATKNKTGDVFVGYAKIRVKTSNSSTQILERFEKFLIEIFGTKAIFVEKQENYWVMAGCSYSYIFTVIDYEVSQNRYVENLLNNCITLNTYSNYLTETTGLEAINIICGMKCYDSEFDMSCNIKEDIIDFNFDYEVSLAIDEFVKKSTSANQKSPEKIYGKVDLYEYNYVYTELKKSLNKKLNK